MIRLTNFIDELFSDVLTHYILIFFASVYTFQCVLALLYRFLRYTVDLESLVIKYFIALISSDLAFPQDSG